MAGALGVGDLQQSDREVEPLKLSILPPTEAAFIGQAANISPDGRFLAFVAPAGSKELLWVRPLDSVEGRPIPGTENAGLPFWSQDSRSLGFFAGTKLKRVELAGGGVQTVCDAPRGFGGAWNRDGVIVFAPDPLSRLYRVPSTGGTPTPVTEMDTSRREFAHRWPQFLPDGARFIYFANSRRSEDNAIYLAKLGSNDRIRLVSAFGNAAWSQVRTGGLLARETDYLLFFREGSLLGQRIDTSRFQAVGEPVPIASPVSYGISATHADFSVSDNGVLAYLSPRGGAGEQLAWRDRAGKDLGSVALPGPRTYMNPALSPDANVLATSILNPEGGYSIWLIDLKSGTPSRFTF